MYTFRCLPTFQYGRVLSVLKQHELKHLTPKVIQILHGVRQVFSFHKTILGHRSQFCITQTHTFCRLETICPTKVDGRLCANKS